MSIIHLFKLKIVNIKKQKGMNFDRASKHDDKIEEVRRKVFVTSERAFIRYNERKLFPRQQLQITKYKFFVSILKLRILAWHLPHKMR